jgi:hypothetical protein
MQQTETPVSPNERRGFGVYGAREQPGMQPRVPADAHAEDRAAGRTTGQ